jgi:ATP adenylyltransferase/5',5'''-P-1,P-4-tetraphosphate phosphorylase II
MKEIVEAKKKKDQAKKLTEGDFDTEYELMEKRQGQPFYDPSLPDDFASGGIARMLGE